MTNSSSSSNSWTNKDRLNKLVTHSISPHASSSRSSFIHGFGLNKPLSLISTYEFSHNSDCSTNFVLPLQEDMSPRIKLTARLVEYSTPSHEKPDGADSIHEVESSARRVPFEEEAEASTSGDLRLDNE